MDPKTSLAFDDFFADEDGNPNRDMPGTAMSMRLEERDGVTTMTMVSQFASIEQMEQLVAMGMLEGMKAAAGQIDALL